MSRSHQHLSDESSAQPFLLLRGAGVRRVRGSNGGLTVVAMAQTKAASSRAMATVTSPVGLPRAEGRPAAVIEHSRVQA
jgi:hypothetical protein